MRTQLVGFTLGIIGFMGTILICALPMWKVTPFVGANIVTAEVFWQGLWMNCVLQSTGHLQCKAYDSVLALPRYLGGSRGLICVSLGVSAVAIGLSMVGMQCCTFCRDDRRAKVNIGVAGGSVFMVAGVLCIVPVSWSAHIIITDFNSPIVSDGLKGELGASIYVGWVSGALLVIAGALLCITFKCGGR